jgi:integrase
MPSSEEIDSWLARIYMKYGQAKGLMAELILKTGVRREEAACWRIDTLPLDPSKWNIPNRESPRQKQKVLVEIKYGCKGEFYGTDHNDKIGPAGTIRIPLELAEKLNLYWKRNRTSALKKWVLAGRTVADQRERAKNAVHLFLDEKSGERIRARDLYEAWTGVELPMEGWCPHRGRDWWACSTLLRELKRHEQLLQSGLDVSHALLESAAIGVIRLLIQPQLRHANDSTSMTYLYWVSDTLGFDLSIEYQKLPDEDDE